MEWPFSGLFFDFRVLSTFEGYLLKITFKYFLGIRGWGKSAARKRWKRGTVGKCGRQCAENAQNADDWLAVRWLAVGAVQSYLSRENVMCVVHGALCKCKRTFCSLHGQEPPTFWTGQHPTQPHYLVCLPFVSTWPPTNFNLGTKYNFRISFWATQMPTL